MKMSLKRLAQVSVKNQKTLIQSIGQSIIYIKLLSSTRLASETPNVWHSIVAECKTIQSPWNLGIGWSTMWFPDNVPLDISLNQIQIAAKEVVLWRCKKKYIFSACNLKMFNFHIYFIQFAHQSNSELFFIWSNFRPV